MVLTVIGDLARPRRRHRSSKLLAMGISALILLLAAPLSAQESETTTSTGAANDLQAAIDAIKRRVAEQQEVREGQGQSALATELRSARESIAELTQSLTRLRGERDSLAAELEASRAAEAALAAEVATLREAEADLQAALATAEGKADAAADELTARLEEAAADLAARERELVEMRQLVDAEAVARQQLEEQLAAVEAERGRLADQRAASARQLEGLESELAEARKAAQGLMVELTAERERAAAGETAMAAVEDRLAKAENAGREAAARAATLENEVTELREVARRSIGEVEALGDTLLAALAENAELATALAETQATRALLESELKAMRLELDSGSQAAAGSAVDVTMPPALVSSDAAAEELDAELAAARREIEALTEELIARDKQLAEGAASGDVDSLTQQIGLLQRQVETLGAENAALDAELLELQGRAEPAVPEVATASRDPAAALDRFLTQLNAVDTGDGWWMTVPEGLVFAPGSEELAAGTEPAVAQIAELLSYFGDAPVRIVGHTDSFGDAEVNRALSVERANSVGRALAETHGVDSSRITTEGFGEEQPIASNATIEGRRANRRVEIYIRR